MMVIVMLNYGVAKKDKAKTLLVTWLFSHLTVVTVGGTSTPFLMVGIGPAVAVIIALYLGEWWRNYKLIVVALLIFLTVGKISMILNQNKCSTTLFSIHKPILLPNQ